MQEGMQDENPQLPTYYFKKAFIFILDKKSNSLFLEQIIFLCVTVQLQPATRNQKRLWLCVSSAQAVINTSLYYQRYFQHKFKTQPHTTYCEKN